MKKFYLIALLVSCVMSLSACAKSVNAEETDECRCEHCRQCKYCDYDVDYEGSLEVENADDLFEKQSEQESEVETSVEQTSVEQTTQEEIQTEVVTEAEQEVSVADLTDGEKAARKQQQINLVAAREQIYSQPNSLDKTIKINEFDKQIAQNNSYDFSGKTIQFLGDSITEAIEGRVDEDGNFISYVNYVNDYLKFGNCINNGKAGRMYSDYGGEELSLSHNMGNIYTNSADISVIFLGGNDFLTNRDGKRYGDINDTVSTAGYVGAVRNTLKQLKNNYPEQDIFFVTMYDLQVKSTSTYTDIEGSPQIGDYMDVLRKLVKEYGYQIIEIYNTGFMDCSDPTTNNIYTADGIHPNDSGNKILGEHIAAELSLYYSIN